MKYTKYKMTALKTGLEMLAAAADVQLKYLASLDMPGNIDELASVFDDIVGDPLGMAEFGEITVKQCDCLSKLDKYLESFSGQSNVHLWTEQALYSAEQWKEVRKLAHNCLELFD